MTTGNCTSGPTSPEHGRAEENLDKIIDKLPTWVPHWARKKAKELMDTAVQKGAVFVLDKAIQAARHRC